MYVCTVCRGPINVRNSQNLLLIGILAGAQEGVSVGFHVDRGWPVHCTLLRADVRKAHVRAAMHVLHIGSLPGL